MKTPRKDARAAGVRHYFTGVPCVRGHIDKRYSVSGMCCACVADIQRARQAASPEKVRATQIQWVKRNPDKIASNWKRWAAKNKAALRVKTQKWREENKARLAASARAWKEKNQDRVLEIKAARRAAKKSATPAWTTPTMRNAIREVYAKAIRLSVTTGITHQVDHIVPLQHPDVCGLHVPWNLQILTASENIRKFNSLLPDADRIPSEIAPPRF